MITDFLEFVDLLRNNQINFKKNELNNVIQKYTFYHISENTFNENEMERINLNITNSVIIMIDQSKELDHETNERYVILGFEKTIILLKISMLSVLRFILIANPQLKICFLSNTENCIKSMIEIKNNVVVVSNEFNDEIHNFGKEFCLIGKKRQKQICSCIKKCISAYLIKKSYFKQNIFRVEKYIYDLDNENRSLKSMSSNEFIELRRIMHGSSFYSMLIYHIKKEELFVIKKPYGNSPETPKLMDRETKNYLRFQNIFLPIYYGTVKETKSIVIEYITGKTLDNIENKYLSYNDRINIIFEILIIIQYFHNRQFIYRDLKPNNIMINENKMVVLIDLDRLIENDDLTEANQTLDLFHEFIDPAVNQLKRFSYETDIFSVGKIIKYIMKGSEAKDNFLEYISNKCIDSNIRKRPNILEIIQEFITVYQKEIKIDNYQAKYKEHFENFIIINRIICLPFATKSPVILCEIAILFITKKYVREDISKAIHYYSLAANLNYPDANYNLGIIYLMSEHRDYNKATHYLALAAKQNNSNAQFFLGIIYRLGLNGEKNIRKSLKYLNMSVNQNNLEALYNLGIFYLDGKYCKIDISRAIHYFEIASNLNDSRAHLILGEIYGNGYYCLKDINKSIHYLTLAANKNDPKAQFCLGMIYLQNRLNNQDIEKAIKYLNLSANQNFVEAQFNLGLIYASGDYVKINMKLAINYFSLSANKNFMKSQMALANIYYEGKYVKQDIKKAIFYYSLAAQQNNQNAMINLGVIFISGENGEKDTGKAIKNFRLAADQNNSIAQLYLGKIFLLDYYGRKDIYQGIHYLTLAANQNNSEAQYILGIIYSTEEYAKQDMKKAIHYFKLAADQNNPDALFNLAIIYEKGNYVKRNIKRSLHYFTLAANLNDQQSMIKLGLFYLFGEYIQQDINKCIHYLTLAANKNNSEAQFDLGYVYLLEELSAYNVKKGFYYINLASNNNNRSANFIHAYFLHEGSIIKRDIQKAISLYKNASNVYNQYAKNNLGVIYKNGFGNEIPKRIGLAIEYFKEAINQKNDYLSMYNLAHLYIYNETFSHNISEWIELLLKLFNILYQSFFLLWTALIKHLGFDSKAILCEFKKVIGNEAEKFSQQLELIISQAKEKGKPYFDNLYESYRNIDFIYNNEMQPIHSPDPLNINLLNHKAFIHKYTNARSLSFQFYDGFGKDLI